MSGCRVSRRSIFLATNTILEGGTAVGNCFACYSVTENASNAFVLPYFAIFYSIDGKKPINSGSTKRGKLNERVIYS